MPHPHHKSRIAALQALFEADITGHDPEPALARIRTDQELPEEGSDFALELVNGVTGNRIRLDDLIGRHAPLWPVGELPAIDRNILRIAIFEMFIHNRVSVKIAINEAVELAKTFGSDASPKFVNGVLGALSGQVTHGAEG